MGDDGFRIYGTPDPQSDQAPPAGGMRGEGNATPDGGPTMRHAVTLENGRQVAVGETSGVAHVEALAETPSRGRVERVPLWPLAVIAGAIGYGLGRWRRVREERGAAVPAAFTAPAGAAGGFAQVRDAGPAAARDEDVARWDRVDESSDESFPASDPPAY